MRHSPPPALIWQTSNDTSQRTFLDRDAILLWIRNRKEAVQSITFSEVCLENRDYALAIKREFRSWARALEAAFPSNDSTGS